MVSYVYYEQPGYVIAGGVVLPVFAIIATALRLHLRRKQRQALKADDWLVLPALTFAVAIAVLMIYAVSQHALAHTLEIPSDFEGSPLELATTQVILGSKIQVAILLMLPFGLGCAKASILLFYIRIFVTTKRSKRYGIFVANIVLIAMMMIGFFFATLFECGSHISAMWQSAEVLVAYCPNSESYDYGFSISDFITDVIILVMPIPLIWRLNMAARNKMALISTFIVGASSVVASLIRMIILTGIFFKGISADEDVILVLTASLYWGMISTNIAATAASLPSLHPLVTDLSLARIFESARNLLSLRSLRTRVASDAIQVTCQDDQSAYYAYRGDGSNNRTGRPGSKTSDQHSLVPDAYVMGKIRGHEEV